MNENERKLSTELNSERIKNEYLERKVIEQEKEIQILASILIITLIALFSFLSIHYEYEMEKIYEDAVALVTGGVIFCFSYKKYPKISSAIFCSFFILAAYKKGGFIKWSLGIFFAYLLVSNFFKKNDV
jgi:hypothetical protein